MELRLRMMKDLATILTTLRKGRRQKMLISASLMTDFRTTYNYLHLNLLPRLLPPLSL